MRAMSEVVVGLDTTADKIRALLREGHLWADVARFLDIRYQHVRKVAVDAGIEQGLQRGIVVVPSEKPPPAVREETAIDLLVDAGFSLLGTWVATDARIGLSTPAPKDPRGLCLCRRRRGKIHRGDEDGLCSSHVQLFETGQHAAHQPTHQ